MSITYNWSVNTLESNTSDGKVTAVHYDVTGVDGEYFARRYGSVGLSGEVTVPYSELTEEQCIEWVKVALGTESDSDDEAAPFTPKIAAARGEKSVQDSIASQIENLRNPPSVRGTPWSNESVSTADIAE